MKTLIAYYSFTQNNEKLANHLRQRLKCDIAKIETVTNRTGLSILLDLIFKRKPALKPLARHLEAYDYVIFIAPIWAGKIAMPLKSLLIKERIHIKRYSFITLCGGRPGQQEKIEKELASILHKDPVKVMELRIIDLLLADQKDTSRHTSGFRIEADGFQNVENQLQDFITAAKLISAG